MASRKDRNMRELPPAPINEEERPLLDEEHPDHGTITEQQAHQEHLDGTDGAESQTTVVEEPSTARLLLTILPTFLGSFFAAAGKTIDDMRRRVGSMLMFHARLDHSGYTCLAY